MQEIHSKTRTTPSSSKATDSRVSWYELATPKAASDTYRPTETTTRQGTHGSNNHNNNNLKEKLLVPSLWERTGRSVGLHIALFPTTMIVVVADL